MKKLIDNLVKIFYFYHLKTNEMRPYHLIIFNLIQENHYES